MSPLGIILIVLLVLLLMGGGWGWRSGWYTGSPGPFYGGGLVFMVLVVLLVLMLAGRI